MAASSLCNSNLALRSCNRKTQLRRVCLENLIAALFFFCGEVPRSRCYGPTAALRLIVQHMMKISFLFPIFLVMEHRWNEIDREKPKYSGKKPVPVPRCLPQIPHELTPGSNPVLRGEWPVTNCLSHGVCVCLFGNLLRAFRSGLLLPFSKKIKTEASYLRRIQSSTHSLWKPSSTHSFA
jgi:hypothetical protein